MQVPVAMPFRHLSAGWVFRHWAIFHNQRLEIMVMASRRNEDAGLILIPFA